jgi:hypothetical protein
MKEVTPNLFRCQFFEILQFSETRQLGERVFYWAVFCADKYYQYLTVTNSAY